jgi:hypothetical protein
MRKINNDDIYLKEDSHEYILKSGEDVKFTSCTTFIDYFFEPFDSIGIANNLVLNHPKYMGIDPRDIVANWENAAELGTFVHAEIENFIKTGKIPLLPKSKAGVKWMENNINENTEVFSEVIVYSKELKLAGTVDLILHNKSNGSYELFDWKTNKKIDTKSYGGKSGITSATRHLPDCNFYHYVLQLSLYRYLIEKNYGIQITNQTILHLNDYEAKPYQVEYLKNEIVNMLKLDRDSLRRQSEESLTKQYVY